MATLNHITIGGAQVGLYFGYPCFNSYTTACFENAEFASLQDGAGVAKLFQCAYINHCLLKEVKPVLTYEDFYMWVEAMINGDTKEVIEDLLNTWAECTTTKKSLERIKELADSVDEKKNLIAV